MNTPSPTQLEAIGRAISEHGLAAVSADELRPIVAMARQLGVSPVLAAVLADPAEPEVARIRAFGRIAAALTGRRVRPTLSTERAA